MGGCKLLQSSISYLLNINSLVYCTVHVIKILAPILVKGRIEMWARD